MKLNYDYYGLRSKYKHQNTLMINIFILCPINKKSDGIFLHLRKVKIYCIFLVRNILQDISFCFFMSSVVLVVSLAHSLIPYKTGIHVT